MNLYTFIKIFLAGLLFNFSFTPHGHSTPDENLKTIYVVADHWPTYTEAQGKGLYFEVIRRIYEPLGYTIKPQIIPFRRAISYINLAKTDIFLADDNLRYLTKLDIYNAAKILQPLMPLDQSLVTAIYWKNKRSDWQSIRNNSSLKMAWVNGYGYGKTLDLPHKNIFLVNDTRQGLRLLRSGRIDCFIDDLSDTNVVTKQMGLNVDDFHFEVISHRHLYPIFTNNARGKKLMAIYEEAMKAMVKSGELFRLYQTVDLNYREILDSSAAGLIYSEPAQAQ